MSDGNWITWGLQNEMFASFTSCMLGLLSKPYCWAAKSMMNEAGAWLRCQCCCRKIWSKSPTAYQPFRGGIRDTHCDYLDLYLRIVLLEYNAMHTQDMILGA